MKPGDVLRWEDCPFFNEVEQKSRWLVCIGTHSMGFFTLGNDLVRSLEGLSEF
jgi:hypothetical protein